MESGPPAPLAVALPSGSRETPWPFWATFLGGVLVASGLLLPLAPFLLYLTGFSAGYRSEAEVEAWSLSANLLEGLGFVSGFIGIAAALRLPAPASRGTTGRGLLVVLLGGVLVAAGIVVTTLAAGYVLVAGPFPPVLFIDLGTLGGSLLQAPGFILVFAGIAWTLRARLRT